MLAPELLRPVLNDNAPALVLREEEPFMKVCHTKSACDIYFMVTRALSAEMQGAAVLLFSEGMALWL